MYGFAANVSLSASSLLRGVTASFSPNPAATSSTLTLRVASTVAVGTFNISVRGVSGSLSHRITISLTVHH